VKTAFLVKRVARKVALHLSLRYVGDPEGAYTEMEAGEASLGDQEHEMA